jgi:hypothetical protein
LREAMPRSGTSLLLRPRFTIWGFGRKARSTILHHR